MLSRAPGARTRSVASVTAGECVTSMEAPSPLKAVQKKQQCGLFDGGQLGGGFVGEKQPGSAGQCHSEVRPGGLAAGQGPRAAWVRTPS